MIPKEALEAMQNARIAFTKGAIERADGGLTNLDYPPFELELLMAQALLPHLVTDEAVKRALYARHVAMWNLGIDPPNYEDIIFTETEFQLMDIALNAFVAALGDGDA